MNPFYYIGSAVIACGFIFVGWNGEGYLSNICLIIGGFCFGALITDALNYNENKPNNTTEGA
jgi:hypothetical protein